MKTCTIDGNKAVARVSYLFTELSGIYPITPSSPMAEVVDRYSSEGKLNVFNDTVKVEEMQSEAGAIALVHGALQNGTLATTYTASQGLLLMIPSMYKIAGEMLPCVMHVAARSLSTHALSIFGDHQDIYAVRQTGFCMLASSSVQDAAYMSALAHLVSIDTSLPFLHFMDGFRTSHEIQKINMLDDEEYKSLLNMDAVERFRNKALNPMHPKSRGMAENDDIYFQATEARNVFYDKVPSKVEEYMDKINKLAKTDYKPFNYYGDKNATKIIVAMGSVCNTIKEVIDHESSDLGLIEVHLYRPFSVDHLKKVLPKSVEKIAVLDRTKEFGSIGEPLYLDVVSALKDLNIEIVGGRYGLSSRDTTPNQIKAVYNMLDNPKHNFTIGITDDVTNLSLKDIDLDIKNSKDILIYGIGSDGMVSCSKSIIRMVGDCTDNFVQGYFEYDSKKSGGVTKSHLRISDKPINSSYYINKPDVLVISKDTYLNSFNVVDDIANNSIVLINTEKNELEINKMFTKEFKNLLDVSNSKIYTIDANKIASKLKLGDKISMIMEYAIMYLTKIMKPDIVYTEMIDYINKKFAKKEDYIVDANIKSLDEVEKNIKEIKLVDCDNSNIVINPNLIDMLIHRNGYKLPTSAFVTSPDGTFIKETSIMDKRIVSKTIPNYIMDNCTNCNFCSLVCPHGVIRPFLLTEEEYNNAPDYVKEKCKKAIGMDYYFTIAISATHCTGCGLCISTCPGMRGNKALEFNTNIEEEQKRFDYLNSNIKEREYNNSTIKNSQFKNPGFKYCGACSGCGEASYIKLLTQICDDNLIIANATGCSSIYGGSVPSNPYSISWASSLFEDNAEYGYGMMKGVNVIRNRIKTIMENNIDNDNSKLFKKWLENYDNYEITKEVYDALTDDIPEELKELKDFIPTRSIWCVGGDGWAYDIGYGGIDHVLSKGENIKMLVLDSEMYSNTGGQASKSSPIGSLELFASTGKKSHKKDLARILMSYENVYVATISLGANMLQTIKVLKEANEYNGPAIVIAYSPCISHGINSGYNSLDMQKKAVECGYFPLFRRHPTNGFTLDTKAADFDKYDEFLNLQTRYSSLKKVNKNYKELLEENKANAKERYEYLCSLK